MSDRWRFGAVLRRPLLLFAVVAGLLVAASAPKAAAPATRGQLTLYTTPLAQQFIDNNDDEARGDVNNPWGAHDSAASNRIDEHTDGPYPGDETLFGFGVYRNARLTGKVGSAVYTCQYYFSKNGFCDAEYQLRGGRSSPPERSTSTPRVSRSRSRAVTGPTTTSTVRSRSVRPGSKRNASASASTDEPRQVQRRHFAMVVRSARLMFAVAE